MLKSIKSYLMDLIIVTAGVLIALFFSNIKENNQAKKYHKASIAAVNNEVKLNYGDLKDVVDKQKKLSDTLAKYFEEPIVIGEIFVKSGGLQQATLNHSGLELYKRNEISTIDLELMTSLNNINSLSKLIDNKLNRLVNFSYENMLDSSRNSKMVLSNHLRDVLGTEKKLLKLYQNYIDNNIEHNLNWI